METDCVSCDLTVLRVADVAYCGIRAYYSLQLLYADEVMLLLQGFALHFRFHCSRTTEKNDVLVHCLSSVILYKLTDVTE